MHYDVQVLQMVVVECRVTAERGVYIAYKRHVLQPQRRQAHTSRLRAHATTATSVYGRVPSMPVRRAVRSADSEY